MSFRYRDRREAGDKLSEKLREMRATNAVVLGIPRGGVVVAARVAEKLHLPLDIIIPRKIGAPFNPELAIGAVMQDGTVLLNESVVKHYSLRKEEISKLADQQIDEIKRRMIKYRGSDRYPNYAGKNIILVDDGIATGFTVRAAVKYIRNTFQPRQIILAVPVAPPDTMEMLSREVEKVACPLMPEIFYAVGQFYEKFEQTTDEEVISLLHKKGQKEKY